MHGLPKPRNKLLQWFDKLTPGRAEYIKTEIKLLLTEKKGKENMNLVESMLQIPNIHIPIVMVKEN